MRNSSLLFAISILVATSLTGCTAEARKNRSAKRADRYFQAGEFEKAKIEYMNVLRADSRNGAAFKRLGLIWSEQGVPLRALPFFLRAKELSPADDDVRTKLALSMISLGGHAEARKEALAILERTPGHEEALHILSDTSRTPEEIAEAEQLLAKSPNRESATFYLASATLLLRKRDLAGAESALLRALAADPKFALAHAALGTVHLLHQKKEKAEQELKTAAELSPVRSPARLRYAEFKAQTGAPEEAMTFLQAMVAKAEDYFPARVLQAQLLLNEKKHEEGLKILEGVLRQDAENVDGRMLQAKAWLMQGETKKAVEALDRLCKAFPAAPSARYLLARAHLLNSDPAQATIALDQAITANPNYTEAILLRAELNLRKGEAQPVVTAMTDLLIKQPGLMQAQLLLAESYRIAGRLDDAATIFRTLIKSAPDNVQFHVLLGSVLRQQMKIDEARKSFEKTMELAPENLNALSQLVDLDLTEQNFAAAIERVQRQMTKTPRSAALYFLQGRVYAAQREWNHAEAALQEALKLDSSLSAAYDLLISTYINTNKLPQAVARLEALVEREPENLRALMLLALIQEELKDFQKAAASYERLLALNPEFMLALNNLAYLYVERINQPERAHTLARRARVADPSNPSVADTLGWILYRRGEYQQAVALLQESAGRLPENLEVQYHLGMAAYMAGKIDIARAALHLAAKDDSAPERKEAAQRRLAALDHVLSPDRRGSVEEIEAALKGRPEDPLLLGQLGIAYQHEGRHHDAKAAFERALSANPRLLNAMVGLAELYAGPLKDFRKALDAARKARDLAPNDPQVGALLGRVIFHSGNHSWAYSLLQESARHLRDAPQVQYDWGLAAYSLGRVDEARKAMERVAATSSTQEIVVEAKTFLTFTAPGEKDAVASLAPAAAEQLKRDPSYIPALMICAADDAQRADDIGAAEAYERVLQIYPEFAPAQKHLAALYARDPARATQAYDLAVKARKGLPGDEEVARMLAELRYRRKEFAAAIQLLEESAREKRLDSKSLYYLGMSCLQAKQAEKGQRMLEQAMAAGLEEPLLVEAKRALSSIDIGEHRSRP